MKNNTIIFAAIIIILAALHMVQDLTTTILMGLFLSIMLAPVTNWLTDKGVPRSLSSALLLVVFSIVVGVFSGYLSTNVTEFISDSPNIVGGLKTYLNGVESELASYGVPINILDSIDVGQAMKTGLSVLEKFGVVMSKAFIVLLVGYFMLLEAPRWHEKVVEITGNSDQPSKIEETVKVYISVKTLTSLMTGVVIAASLMLIGHKYWVLWGFLAFILNYIPNIGSIIAAIPAIIVAVATMGQVDAALTVGAYVFANVAIGSILEPKILGDKLGLSTLVILLSMLFWGFLFGAVGMFLSVPITIAIKILLGEKNKVAKLLGS